MIRRHALGFRAALMAVDAGLAAALLVVLSIWRFGPDWAVWWRQIVPEPVAFLGLYTLGWVLALTLNGLYRPRARWSLKGEAADIVRATVAMSLVTFSVLFIFNLPDVSRIFLLTLFPAQAVLTIVSRALLRGALERYRRRGGNRRFVLVLGAGPRAQAFAAKLEDHRELGLKVVGFLDDEQPPMSPRWNHLGPIDQIERVLHDQIVDEVAICLPFSRLAEIDALARLCEEEGKIVRIPLEVLDRAISAGRIEDLDGTPVYSLVSGPDRAIALATKRFLDIAAASVGLVLLTPLFALIAVAIALGDGRPIVFRQVRVGLHGRPFRIVKFRTMDRDAEARRESLAERNEIDGRAFKMAADPRVTNVGRWLRRLSFDELPQLWNVMRGEMSLVGPRPPLPAEVANYDLWHRRRLSMKPGITGLWQVRGRRDPEFDRWVAADLEYIDRWSLWLDVKILAQTIPAALEGR